jgi:hypothetical protein
MDDIRYCVPDLRCPFNQDGIMPPEGDAIVVLDEDTGRTYVFRGARMYELVDGKEVLREQGSEDTCHRSGE